LESDKKIKTVIIHGNKCQLDDVKEVIEKAKQSKWEKTKWTEPLSLKEKSNGTLRSYHGQSFDAKYFELSKEAWTHDHCLICYCRIDLVNPTLENYTDGYNWICTECYDQFFSEEKINNSC
jgi:hypothetical protein